MNPKRVLHFVGLVELLTLTVLVVNLMVFHRSEVSSFIGPIHGLAYCVTVIAAILFSNRKHIVWLLALIPGIGGLLASRLVRSTSELDDNSRHKIGSTL